MTTGGRSWPAKDVGEKWVEAAELRRRLTARYPRPDLPPDIEAAESIGSSPVRAWGRALARIERTSIRSDGRHYRVERQLRQGGKAAARYKLVVVSDDREDGEPGEETLAQVVTLAPAELVQGSAPRVPVTEDQAPADAGQGLIDLGGE